MTWDGFRTAVAEDAAGVEAVLQAADARKLSRREISWAIEQESGWNPRARNAASDAIGLLQFTPATLRGLGFEGSVDDFAELPRGKQAKWVYRFFGGAAVPAGDVRLRMFFPAAVGKPDNFLIARKGGPHEDIWRANKGLRWSHVDATTGKRVYSGPITAGSVRVRSRNIPAGGPDDDAPIVPPKKDVPARPSPGGNGWGNLLLIVAIAYALGKGKRWI